MTKAVPSLCWAEQGSHPGHIKTRFQLRVTPVSEPLGTFCACLWSEQTQPGRAMLQGQIMALFHVTGCRKPSPSPPSWAFSNELSVL